MNEGFFGISLHYVRVCKYFWNGPATAKFNVRGCMLCFRFIVVCPGVLVQREGVLIMEESWDLSTLRGLYFPIVHMGSYIRTSLTSHSNSPLWLHHLLGLLVITYTGRAQIELVLHIILPTQLYPRVVLNTVPSALTPPSDLREGLEWHPTGMEAFLKANEKDMYFSKEQHIKHFTSSSGWIHYNN